MCPDLIQKLIKQLPIPDKYVGRELTVLEAREADASRFVTHYKDLAFSWNYILHTLNNNLPLTNLLGKEDGVIQETYWWLKNYEYDAPHIERAFAIYKDPKPLTRNLIEACLLVDSVDMQRTARFLGLDPRVILTYEKLFYNVLDRRADAIIITEILYPNSRMMTMTEGAMDAEDYGLTLKRAGFQNGIEDVLFFGGFKESVIKELVRDANVTQRLEQTIMHNGLMLARNGWTNTRHAGLTHAKALIAAAKQGGNDAAVADDLPGFGDSFTAEMKQVKLAEAGQALLAN